MGAKVAGRCRSTGRQHFYMIVCPWRAGGGPLTTRTRNALNGCNGLWSSLVGWTLGLALCRRLCLCQRVCVCARVSVVARAAQRWDGLWWVPPKRPAEGPDRFWARFWYHVYQRISSASQSVRKRVHVYVRQTIGNPKHHPPSTSRLHTKY